MPHTEHGTGDGDHGIGGEVERGEAGGQSAVLHAHLDADGAALGIGQTIRKSSSLSAMPMPSMMTPSSGLITVGLMPLNAPGTISATTAAKSTSTPI